MVNQCSYCVLKVPNDDGPSMSIIEFFLLFPLLPLQYGALGEQFNQLPQTLFFFHCHEIHVIVTSPVSKVVKTMCSKKHTGWWPPKNTKNVVMLKRKAKKNLTNMVLHMSLPPICKSVKSNHDVCFCFS